MQQHAKRLEVVGNTAIYIRRLTLKSIRIALPTRSAHDLLIINPSKFFV